MLGLSSSRQNGHFLGRMPSAGKTVFPQCGHGVGPMPDAASASAGLKHIGCPFSSFPAGVGSLRSIAAERHYPLIWLKATATAFDSYSLFKQVRCEVTDKMDFQNGKLESKP